MRLLLGVGLLLLSAFIGYVLSNKYYYRRIFFDDFVAFNNKLKQNISFKQTTLIKFIKEQKEQSDFYLSLNKFICEKDENINLSYLQADEINYFCEYMKSLGKDDAKTQIKFIDNINCKIIEIQKNVSEDEKKYKSLYIKLGILIGLILLILVL